MITVKNLLIAISHCQHDGDVDGEVAVVFVPLSFSYAPYPHAWISGTVAGTKKSKNIISTPHFLFIVAYVVSLFLATHGPSLHDPIHIDSGWETNLLKNGDLLCAGLVGRVHDHRVLLLEHEKLDILQQTIVAAGFNWCWWGRRPVLRSIATILSNDKRKNQRGSKMQPSDKTRVHQV